MIVTHDSRISLVSCIEGVVVPPADATLIRVSLPVPHHAADLSTAAFQRQFFYTRTSVIDEEPAMGERILVITFRVTPKDEGSNRLPKLRTRPGGPDLDNATVTGDLPQAGQATEDLGDR
jgi:hypothetical protein